MSSELSTAQKPVRGAFIVLEGLDRSGKTTQVELLGERLRKGGRKVEMMRFPDRTTPIGKMIDGYLRSQEEMDDHVIHLLFSANRWEAARKIESLLSSGTTIISDRYHLSGIIYSAAKHNPLLPLSWAKNPEINLPKPDLVVFLDLSAEEQAKRGGWGEEKYEKEEMQGRVREGFRGLKEEGKDAKGGWGKGLEVVSAEGGKEEVRERVWGVVEGVVREVEGGQRGEEVGRVE